MLFENTLQIHTKTHNKNLSQSLSNSKGPMLSALSKEVKSAEINAKERDIKNNIEGIIQIEKQKLNKYDRRIYKRLKRYYKSSLYQLKESEKSIKTFAVYDKPLEKELEEEQEYINKVAVDAMKKDTGYLKTMKPIWKKLLKKIKKWKPMKKRLKESMPGPTELKQIKTKGYCQRYNNPIYIPFPPYYIGGSPTVYNKCMFWHKYYTKQERDADMKSLLASYKAGYKKALKLDFKYSDILYEKLTQVNKSWNLSKDKM